MRARKEEWAVIRAKNQGPFAGLDAGFFAELRELKREIDREEDDDDPGDE